MPWGKHTPVGDDEYRLSHVTAKDKGVDPNNILPAVTIRDPVRDNDVVVELYGMMYVSRIMSFHLPVVCLDAKHVSYSL